MTLPKEIAPQSSTGGKSVEEKLRIFLEKKSRKLGPLKDNALKAKIAADNAKQQLLYDVPELPLGHDYSARYYNSIDKKFLTIDKKILPDNLSDAMKADIALQRVEAFKRAERYSPQYVRRKAMEIQGSNYRIPEWMIIRDDEKTLDPVHSVEKISFPNQFLTKNPKYLDHVKLAKEFASSSQHANVSEPKLQGFHNEKGHISYFPIDTSDEAIKGFFRNYLEVTRLNSRAPFYAWIEANCRESRPILTLKNRAKPLKPIFYVGRARRPFPVEVGGVTYFCEGNDAETFFLALPKEQRGLFIQCCIVKAVRNFLSNDDIIRGVMDIGPLKDIVDNANAPILELEVQDTKYWEFKDILSELTDWQLSQLVEKGLLSRRQQEIVSGNRAFWATLPRSEQFLLMLDSDKRTDAYNAEIARKQDIRQEIYDLVGEPELEAGYALAEKSLFDDLGSDEEGGFFDFDALEEEEGSPSSQEENEEDPDPITLLDPGNSLNLAEATDEELSRASMKFDPRFISEIRLWPTSRNIWHPP